MLYRTFKQHRLATFTGPLLRDALTVALGVKTAALLDFHLPPPVLELVLQRIHATDTRLFAPLVCLAVSAAASDGSAVFLLHRPSFLSQSPLPASSTPLIDVSPALSGPQLLSDAAHSVVAAELRSFQSQLSTALHADPSASYLALPSTTAGLPTLCGWLLSYPLLYSFPLSTVVPSTNSLSHQPLTVYAVRLHPTPLLSRLSPSFISEVGSVLLQSFSVPTALLSESVVVSAMQSWEKRIGEVCRDEAVRLWVDRLSISTTAVCLPHVSL